MNVNDVRWDTYRCAAGGCRCLAMRAIHVPTGKSVDSRDVCPDETSQIKMRSRLFVELLALEAAELWSAV